MSRRSEDDRFRVIALSAAGSSKASISRQTGFSRAFVSRWFGQHDVSDASRSGPPVKLTPPVQRTVRALLKGKKGRSTRKVLRLLMERKRVRLSHESIRKAAIAAGLKAYHRPHKPLVTNQVRQRRLRFVRMYRNTDWRHVLFTDEKTFQLFGRPNRQNDIIWETSAANVTGTPSVKHSAKVHVWGGISYYGKTDLHLFHENMDADLYVSILEEHLDRVPDMFPDRTWMLQQDSDPKHTSKEAVRWLHEHVPAFIPKEHWPPNSPDLNVIEHLWSVLQDRVYAREPRTITALERIIRDEWNAIETETLRNLVNSMPQRFAAVRVAQGGPTTY
jgi:transposase